MPDNFLKQYGFDVKDELCPLIWDESKKLKEDVSKVVKQNVVEFLKFVKIPLKPKDVILVGSLAGYNWSKFSDVDVHVLVDIDEMGYDKELITEFFDAKKSIWNEKTDAKIKGFDIEFYIQDVNEENASQGIYSIVSDKWLQSPSKVKEEIDESALKKKVEFLQKEIDNSVEGDCDVDCLNSLRKKIRKMRKSGLQERGEFSIENLAFKALRRNGYIEKMIKKSNELRDKELSLESIMDDAFLMKEANSGTFDNGDVRKIANAIYKIWVRFFDSIDNRYKNYSISYLYRNLNNSHPLIIYLNSFFNNIEGNVYPSKILRNVDLGGIKCSFYVYSDSGKNVVFPSANATTLDMDEELKKITNDKCMIGLGINIDASINDLLYNVDLLKSHAMHEANHVFDYFIGMKTTNRFRNLYKKRESVKKTSKMENKAYISSINQELINNINKYDSFENFLKNSKFWSILKDSYVKDSTRNKVLSKIANLWKQKKQ